MLRLIDIVGRLRQSSLFVDSFWALFGSALGKGLSLIAGIAVARFLGKDVYGEYGMIKNTLLMIAIFSSFGLGYTATKFIAENKKDNPVKTLFVHKISQRITFLVSGFIALLVFIFADYVAIWLDAPHLNGVLRLSAAAIIFNAINTTQTGELSGYNAYKAIAVNSFIVGVLTFILSVVFAYIWNLDGAVIALVISLIVNCLLNSYSLRKYLPKLKVKDADNRLLKEVLFFSLPVALQESLYSVTHWFSVVLLIKLAGYGELGLSSAAGQWMTIMLFIPAALRNVALSHLSSTNSNNKKNESILKRLLAVNFVSTLIPFFFICILSGWICSWYGDDYVGLQSVLNVCVFTAVINSLTNVFTQELMAKGKNWYLFFSRLFRDCFILFTTYFFLLTINESGALIYSLITLLFQVFYLILLLLKYRKLKYAQ